MPRRNTTKRHPAVEESDRAEYVRSLLAAAPGLSLDGKRIVVDCANGAASSVAAQLFDGLQGEVHIHNSSPNGRNINEGCGALHPEVVARMVVEEKADLGITFDGDADRALFADENGKVVNGDAVMLLAARDLQARGLLHDNTVVATTMSNMGLEAALKRSGIRMLRAPVGDKYVLQQMKETRASLGGEQSGHILFTGKSTTGDGLLTALLLLDIVHRRGKSLGELTSDLKTFPAGDCEREGAREKAAGVDSIHCRNHPCGRAGSGGLWSRRDPLQRHGSTGSRHDRGRR